MAIHARFAIAFLLITSNICLAAAPLPPIKVSDNGRFFAKNDGTPFFWLGDTAWCIFNHPTPEDVDLYLDDRAAKGFTVIQGCVAVWSHRTRQNPDGQTPFNSNDPADINLAYFKNVDSIIDKATARGMYVALLPFWTKNTRTGPFSEPEKMKGYTKFLAERYAGKNVFFVLGGDTAGQDIQPVTDAEAAGVLEGAKAAGINKVMMTFHPTGNQSSSFWFHERPWMDFNAIQSGHFINTRNFRLVAGDYAKTPIRPTLDTEPGYENITDRLDRTGNPNAPRIKAQDVRRSAYLAVFAGAAGHTYGNGEVYEFWEPGRAGAMPGWAANLPWKESLKLPASGQMQYLRYLIESRPQLIREPDQSMIAGEVSERAVERMQAMRASDGSYAFVLFQGKPATIQTGKLSGQTIKAWWYDPRTGKARQIEDFAKTDSREFTPPPTGADEGTDWILVLDDAAKNYPPPGTRPPSP